MKTKNEIETWSKSQCLTFLSQHWGLRGINGTGITKELKNRTLRNIRKECKIQFAFSKQYEKAIIQLCDPDLLNDTYEEFMQPEEIGFDTLFYAYQRKHNNKYGEELNTNKVYQELLTLNKK